MAEIRSVSVHLDADVAGYIAKMRLAGAETDKAFGRSNSGIEQTNSRLRTTESTLGDVDRAAGKADTTLRRLDGTLSRSGSNGSGFSRAVGKLDSFVGKLGLVPALALTTTSALIPLAAAAAGVAAAFAAPLVFVGGGLTLFGLLAGAAVKHTLDQNKAIDALAKKLSGLTKGTAEYAQVQKQLKEAQDALAPSQRRFSSSLEGLQSDFAKFIRGPAGGALLDPISQALRLADDLLPHTVPIIRAVSGALGDLLGELDKYVQTPGFDRFVHAISRQIGPDLRTFGHILGDVGPGIGHLLLILGRRLSPGLMHDLSHMSAEFGHWASSKQGRQDVQDFIDYVHRVGPDAADAIESLAKGGAHLVRALAPLGPPTLRVISGIADALSSIPTPVLTALAGGAVGLVALQKLGGLKAIGAVTGGLGGGGLGGGGGILGAARPVPVFVTNPGFGGAAGGAGRGGVFGSFATSPLRFIPQAMILAAAAYETYHATRGIEHNLSQAPKGFGIGAPTLGSSAAPSGAHLNYGKMAEEANGHLKSTTHQWDALTAGVQRASRQIDLVGPHAAHSLGTATKTVANFNDHLHNISAGKASQQMDLVGHSATRNFQAGVAGADKFQHKVSSLHGPKPLHVDADTSSADHKIKATDRSLTVLSQHRATPTVTANTGQAEAALRRVYADLAAIRSKTVYLTTKHVTGGSVKAGADGMTVPGPRYPYGDRTLILAAPGEEVISNRHGEADRFRADRAAGRIPGYADGGVVTHVTRTVGGQQVDPIARHLNDELHKMRQNLAEVNKELQAEQQHRQNLVQAEKQLESTVASNFRSQIFGVTPEGGIWGSGATSDPRRILRGDIRDARTYRRDIGRLRHRGLRDGALAEVTTLADAEQALGLPKGELRDISRLYQIRQRASKAAGALAGDFRYGAQIAAANAQLHHIHAEIKRGNAELHHLRVEQHHHAAAAAKNVANAVNKPAQTARRRGRPG